MKDTPCVRWLSETYADIWERNHGPIPKDRIVLHTCGDESCLNIFHLYMESRGKPMIVMPANNSSMQLGYMAGTWPGRIGWILSPGGWRTPADWMPYALDNGAFPAWTKGLKFDEQAFYDHCQKIVGMTHKPLWIAVPDVVANREETIKSWEHHYPRVAKFCPHLAFVVQNEMTPDDVPKNADLVFVGGTTEWKWATLREWTANFPRVHVGRVNSERMLWMAHEAGAESCDGTGWFRGDQEQFKGLLRYLEESTNGKHQLEMNEVLA